jgi:phosphonate transport system substrate-binding protein
MKRLVSNKRIYFYYCAQLPGPGLRLLFIFLLLLSVPISVVAQGTPDSGVQSSKESAIRIAMSAAFVSEAGIGVYDDISRYLAKKLNREVEFVSGFSYTTINSMMDSGMADLGFICGLPYVMARDKPSPKVDLLLAPVMRDSKYGGRPIYYSYVIVHKDSPYQSFSDLRESRFVYNDEISNSGYNMPRAHLIELGETRGFFKDTIRSGSHEESIRMVALGKSDVSAVDSLVYDYDQKNNPEFTQQTRILKILGPAGIPPIVISSKTPKPLRDKIRSILLEMNKDPFGKAILNKALLKAFVPVEDNNYNGIREMDRRARKVGFLVIK